MQRFVSRSTRVLASQSRVAAPLFTQSTRSFASKAEVLNTPDAPAAIGPYSQGIKVNGFIYVSGSLGLNPKTGEFPGKDVESQTKQSLDNIVAILKAGNSSMKNVVKTTVLLADMKDFPKVNEIYASCQYNFTWSWSIIDPSINSFQRFTWMKQ